MSMCVTKQILYDQDAIIIEYEVRGQMMVSNTKNANRAWKLHEQLGKVLGLDKDLIDLQR